uniref:Uncharacterized protein n=1 Tax=Brassica oleracea TaxID=3712 RepID=A0A3P6EE03_BRAOL|nr:unnamed protein product [Brassica oleracea]
MVKQEPKVQTSSKKEMSLSSPSRSSSLSSSSPKIKNKKTSLSHKPNCALKPISTSLLHLLILYLNIFLMQIPFCPQNPSKESPLKLPTAHLTFYPLLPQLLLHLLPRHRWIKNSIMMIMMMMGCNL